jgi:hypothetical protein
MAIPISLAVALAAYCLLYKILFEDSIEWRKQFFSLFAWMPVSLLLDYDLSDAGWRIWVWAMSGIAFGAFVYFVIR